jgi:pyridoxal phosphate enzyme (YggS family)
MDATAYHEISAKLKEKNVTLVAVSKTQSEASILDMYHAGQRIFGENKVQELTGKYENLPKDIEWHLIGHLQTNKVKYIAPFVSMIHSIDSLKLLEEVNKQARNNNRIIPCLMQMYIANEDTKFGLDAQELYDILESEEYRAMQNIRITGLMGMASFTDDKEQVRQEFQALSMLFKKVKHHHFSADEGFKELSMGMSSDYEIAIEEGSTMVRIGSLLFGAR